MIVRRVFVLADSRFQQRRILHAWEAERQIFTSYTQALPAHETLAMCGIEVWSTCVIGDFESTSLVARDAVHESSAMIGPDGDAFFLEAGVILRRAEEEHILLRCTDA